MSLSSSTNTSLLLLVPSLNQVRQYGAVKKDLLTHLYGGGTSLIENRLTPNTTMDDTHDGSAWSCLA